MEYVNVIAEIKWSRPIGVTVRVVFFLKWLAPDSSTITKFATN